MLTQNEKALIEAIVDAGLSKEVIISVTSALTDEQMPEVTEYLREEIAANRKVTRETMTKVCLILRKENGAIL